VANLYGQIGATQAQGTLGQANTWANLLSNLGGLAMKAGSQYSQLQGLYGSGASSSAQQAYANPSYDY